MGSIKRVFKMLTLNFMTLIKFEFLFKVMTTAIFMPLFLLGFKLAMKLTGYSYLTIENIIGFITNPITIITGLLILIAMTVYSMFEIIGIIVIFDESVRGDKIRLLDVIRAAGTGCLKAFRPSNVLVCFFVLFLIPFVNVGISTNVVDQLKLPEFIMDYIHSNILYTVIYILILVFLAVLLIRWIYSLHYMVLEGLSFRKARKKSIALGKKRYIPDLSSWAIILVLNTVFYMFIIILGIFGIDVLNHVMVNHPIWESIIVTLIGIVIGIALLAYIMLNTPISYAAISNTFYKNKELKGEERAPFDAINTVAGEKTAIAYKRAKTAIIVITFLGIIGGGILSYAVISGRANVNFEVTRVMEITAHRGASVDYPENTMAAFKAAKELGADWIELDVQQTKDGIIIVSHDSNFKRTCKVDKKVWEVTYDEVKTYDAGSAFGKEFAGEKIPSLEEVVEYAKFNNIRLNIELKPTGHEENFEQNVLDIIDKYDFAERCVITSQNYAVLVNVKNINPEIKTIYVMSIGIGNIIELDKADGYSLEATNITKKLVKRLHNNGKEVYAWTVNTDESIKKMIDLNVDNIITDNIDLAKEQVERSKTKTILTVFTDVLEKVVD